MAVLVGLSAACPLSVAFEWAWTDVVEALWWDRRKSDLVEWAGWTIDPFIEEMVRLLPLIVVVALVARARQQWALSDLVVLGAGVGSGYRLAEHLARPGEEVRGPFAEVTNDSGQVLNLAGFQGTLIIPYPWVWIRQWVPEGVQIDWFGLVRSPIGSYNVIAIWEPWVASPWRPGSWSPVSEGSDGFMLWLPGLSLFGTGSHAGFRTHRISAGEFSGLGGVASDVAACGSRTSPAVGGSGPRPVG